MQQGAANKKAISRKEVAKQKAIIQKETIKKTIKIKQKTKIKSFCDFTTLKEHQMASPPILSTFTMVMKAMDRLSKCFLTTCMAEKAQHYNKNIENQNQKSDSIE